jgi:predicted phosphodiesterase
MSEIRPRLSGQRRKAFENLTRDERRILIIGDIHEPFSIDGYLGFCMDVYNRYNCNSVIFIGDVIDSHHSSFHPTDPNGLGGEDELQYAINRVKDWADAFPVADVIIGNHDRIIMRKAFASAIPQQWIKSYNEVLGTNWNWTDRVVYDNVQYVHGEGGTARTRAKNDMQSTVQGHIHTQGLY